MGAHAAPCARGGMLAAHEALHGHPHVVVYHAVRHMPDFPEEPTVRLQEGLRILVQEEVGRTVVAVGHREYSHIQLDAPAVYGEIHLAPVKLTVLSRLVALADEALLRLLRMPQCGADVLADGRIADLETGIAHRRMNVARLHAELPVTPLALLLIVTKAYVDERTHLVSEGCPVPLGHLVRGLALQVGSKGLIPSGLGCKILLDVVLHSLAVNAKIPGYCANGTCLFVFADDVFSLNHTNHRFNCTCFIL